MKRLTIFLAVLLAGCATDPRIVAFDEGRKAVNLDKRVLMECSDLPELTGTSDEEVLAAFKAWGNSHKECRAWKHELNKIVKDAFNVK